MEVIRIQYPQTNDRHFPPTSVALGNFDGVHLGHQEVIKTALGQARTYSLSSAIMTFDPHPKEVLGRIKTPSYITPLPDKLDLFERMGVNFTYLITFTPSLSQCAPGDFIRQFIIDLNIQHVVTGFDFRFGHQGQGDTSTLQHWASEEGSFQMTVCPSVDQHNEKISSTRIRSLLQEGDVRKVSTLLGRYHSCKGMVIEGEKRGRTIGFPTANVDLAHPYVLPGEGVYAVYVWYGENKYQGVLNLGRKPTFHDQYASTLEVHILDFDEHIYGSSLHIEFVSFIRSETKFANVEALKQQIDQDIRQAKRVFSDQQSSLSDGR